ncbi:MULTISPECIES: hypothetical protein [Maribacter]|uniref:DUF4890 domain-containing protein n=1 Tax=Maribacter flavus TaxID=1658664 RepID=A0ABU7IH40_9FLAO|nr:MULTISPECIES: hypothetical protein [Maribacter]MDC6405160.1 hypothetical protein [Maribacter sp. PR66]MEE1972033.1 hypothetical protein [Maribacter flavus]
MRKLVLVALLLMGITAMAQEKNRKEGRRQMGDFTPEQMATLQTKRMTLALDLTADQQSKLQEMFTKNAAERKAKMEAHKARRESWESLSDDEKFALQNERLDNQIAHKKEMKAILDDTQYAKWEKMRAKRGKNAKGKERQHRAQKK